MASSVWEDFKSGIREISAKARHFKLELNPFLRMLGIMGITVLFSFLTYYLYGENVNASVVFTLAVMVVSCATPGYFYSMVASILGVLGVNYFFMWPYLGFNFTRTGYPVTFVLLFFTSYLTSTLMTIYRNQAERARKNERLTDALYRMTNELLRVEEEEEEVGPIVEKWIRSISGCPVHYLSGPGAFIEEPDTLLLPVSAGGRVVGAFEVKMGEALSQDEDIQNILRLFTAQYAMVKEKQLMAAERNKVSLEMEAEKLRANLLRAISHDLRTPLTSILGAISALMESGESLRSQERNQLYSDVRENAQWLIRMVENLLSVTRISQEVASIHKSPELAEEVLAEAAGQIRRRFPGQELKVRAPEEVLFVPMDATLVEQVIINLVENAIYHAGPGAIEVEALREGEDAVFQVRDHGVGVDPERMAQLFDGYIHPTASEDFHRGMGLGLSICASIVRAHGGEITAANAPDGGAVFRFTLPLEGVPQAPSEEP